MPDAAAPKGHAAAEADGRPPLDLEAFTAAFREVLAAQACPTCAAAPGPAGPGTTAEL